ncbi:MAG: hypothetical protein Q9190_002637 [Brigantiaea leucoxantha]
MGLLLTSWEISLDSRTSELEKSVESLKADFSSFKDELIARIDSCEFNSQARTRNSHITHTKTPLHPLRDRMNQAVHPFPKDGEALSKLTSAEAEILLRAFQLSCDGDMEEKRLRIQEFVGMIPLPVSYDLGDFEVVDS